MQLWISSWNCAVNRCASIEWKVSGEKLFFFLLFLFLNIPREFLAKLSETKARLSNRLKIFRLSTMFLKYSLLFSLGKWKWGKFLFFFWGKFYLMQKKKKEKISPAYFRNKTTFDVGRSYRSGSLKFTCSKKIK